MPREKKNSKVKSPSSQPKPKKRRNNQNSGSAAQNIQNAGPPQMQNNNYPNMVNSSPFDDYSNPQSNNQMMDNQMQMNQQIMPQNMQMHNQNYQMSNGNNNLMLQQQQNYNLQMNNQPMNNLQMNGMQNGQMIMQSNNQLNGPPMSNFNQSMMPNNMNPNQMNLQQNRMPFNSDKVYPQNKKIVNANGQQIFVCKSCCKEVHENNQGILCDGGACHYWYHLQCTNLTELAFKFLKENALAEWCCESCEQNPNKPPVRFTP